MTIHSTNGESPHIFKAKAVVVATGFASSVPKRLGLGTVGDYVTGAQAEVAIRDVDEIQVYFGDEVAPGFFAWLVHTSLDKALLGLLCRRNANLHLTALISKLKADGKVHHLIKEPKRWGIPLRPLPKTYGPRVLAVSDAAGQTKPTTGGGIFYALLSADIAVDTLHKAFQANDLSGSMLSRYEKEWKAALAKELRIGYYARRLYEKLNDHQIEQLLRTVTSNGIHHELINDPQLSFDWHGQLIMKAMKFKILSKLIRSINPITAALKSYASKF